MSDAGKREWRFYLEDMIKFAERVLTYTDSFERASHLSPVTIPWRMIIATRNRLIHGYLGIDDETIWSII